MSCKTPHEVYDRPYKSRIYPTAIAIHSANVQNIITSDNKKPGFCCHNGLPVIKDSITHTTKRAEYFKHYFLFNNNCGLFQRK